MHYVHMDQNRTANTTYYYLRQVDHDGTAQHSQVVAVSGSADRTDWSLAPNPARDWFAVLHAPENVLGVRLFDSAGRALRQWAQNMDLDLVGVPAGVYVVRVELASGEVQQQRLVVE